METPLSRCPFCGGDGAKVRDDGGGRVGSNVIVTPLWYWVECAAIDCQARGPRRETARAAALDWNVFGGL